MIAFTAVMALIFMTRFRLSSFGSMIRMAALTSRSSLGALFVADGMRMVQTTADDGMDHKGHDRQNVGKP